MRLMADAGVKCLVMEVSSQALYMSRVYGVEFDVCCFTNLYVDHIGGAEHPTFEHYRDSKKRLFTEFGAKTIIYNADDGYAEYMEEAMREGIELAIMERFSIDADDITVKIENFDAEKDIRDHRCGT